MTFQQENSVILNTLAAHLASKDDRIWDKEIKITVDHRDRNIRVSNDGVYIHAQRVFDGSDPVTLIQQIFNLLDHFDAVAREEHDRQVRVAEAEITKNLLLLSRIEPDRVQPLIEKVLGLGESITLKVIEEDDGNLSSPVPED